MPRDFMVGGVREIYSKYPALYRTSTWKKVVKLAKEGKVQDAQELALDTSRRFKQLNAQNVTARKLRLNRMALFAQHTAMRGVVNKIFKKAAEDSEKAVLHWSGDGSVKGMRELRKELSTAESFLRRELNKWLRDNIWKSILLAVDNIEDALSEIFASNEEGLHPVLKAEQELMEERLSVGVSSELFKKGKTSLSTAKYYAVVDKIYEKIVNSSLKKLKPSDSVWELTKTLGLEMNRIVQRGINQGTSSKDIAKDILKFLSPDVLKSKAVLPKGVYHNPVKNAMRLARTETNRAYASAQAEWASTRSWVKGMMVTLSPAHNPAGDYDVCDRWAGKVLTPDEFSDRVPFHSHCMCFGTVVIKDEFLDEEEK